MKLVLLLILIPSLAFSALNEYYVTDAGAGDGSGQPNEANAMSFTTFTDYMVTGGSKTAAAGDRFNIKGAITARTTTTDTWVNGGTVTSPVIIRGYNASIGDLTSLARTNGNGPLVTTNYPTISYTTGGITLSGGFIILEALSISGANTSGGVGVVRGVTSNDRYLKRCKIVNSSTSANAIAVNLGTRDGVIDCDVSLTGASGGNVAVNMAVGSGKVIGCRITGGPAIGITVAAAGCVVAFNTIYASTGNGISLTTTTSNAFILYNTIVGGGADGINMITASTVSSLFVGNMITDNTGDGIDMVSTANAAFVSNLRTRDNANSINNAGDWITATNYDVVTTDTGGPETDYVSAGSPNFDYNLIWGSPARGAGNPLFADIGALQAPTPTPTPTATATATATFTPTATATATATATPSATVNCAAACPTATATPSATFTPSATASATFTPTATPTPVINNVIYGQ